MVTNNEIIKKFNIEVNGNVISLDEIDDVFNQLEWASISTYRIDIKVKKEENNRILVIYPFETTIEKFLTISDFRKCFLSSMDE